MNVLTETPFACNGKVASNGSMENLYRDNHGWLGGWLRARVSNPADAEELAQDTFVRVLTAHHQRKVQDIREPRAFLATVARRLVANFFRRQSLELAYAEVLANVPEAHVPSLEMQGIMLEALVELDLMLDGLGGRVKQAFLLAQVQGMPYANIAKELDVSLRSVKYYIAKALAHCATLSS